MQPESPGLESVVHLLGVVQIGIICQKLRKMSLVCCYNRILLYIYRKIRI